MTEDRHPKPDAPESSAAPATVRRFVPRIVSHQPDAQPDKSAAFARTVHSSDDDDDPGPRAA